MQLFRALPCAQPLLFTKKTGLLTGNLEKPVNFPLFYTEVFSKFSGELHVINVILRGGHTCIAGSRAIPAKISNGLGLHRTGLIPYCVSLLAVSDHMRNAIRFAATSQV